MGIIAPKFIALDSSHLGGIARDASSPDASRRKAADAFLETLDGCGGILVLSWHHIQELLQHGDKSVVAGRVRFLESLPMVGWVTSLVDDTVPGTIADITAREVSAAFRSPQSDAIAVRNAVTPHMFRIDSGARAVAPFVAAWEQLEPLLRERQEKDRELIAISRSKFADISETKASGRLSGALRSREDAERQIGELQRRLAGDIRHRGDRRIADPMLSAARFFEGVKLTAAQAISDHAGPGLQILKALDIEPEEAGPEAKMGEVLDLVSFRKLLRLASEITRTPFAELKVRVNEGQIPSRVIQSALRRYEQDTPEWKGSDLTDRHLACLAAYAEVTYVDKRTYENITRARRKSPEASKLLRRVEKAGTYAQIAKQL
jgi:hypothetical protein